MTLRAGDVLVNPMGVPLRWRWSGAVKVLNVTVHPGHLGDLARESLGAAVRLRPLRLGHRSDSVLGAFGADLHRELSAPRVLGADRAARAIGERIALHLLRHYLEVERNERDRTFDEDERRERSLFARKETPADRPRPNRRRSLTDFPTYFRSDKDQS